MPGILEILTPSRMPHPPGAATSGTSLPSPRRFGSKVFFQEHACSMVSDSPSWKVRFTSCKAQHPNSSNPRATGCRHTIGKGSIGTNACPLLRVLFCLAGCTSHHVHGPGKTSRHSETRVQHRHLHARSTVALQPQSLQHPNLKLQAFLLGPESDAANLKRQKPLPHGFL